MSDMLARLVTNVIGRVEGPMAFRFVLQPCMAALLATLDGIADARAGRPPYLWSLLTRSGHRGRLLREGSRAVARVLIFGAAIDCVYQLIEFRWVYPLELVVTVLLIVFVPYALVRGAVNRIARLRYLGASPTQRTDTLPEERPPKR